ncbi:MAG: NAD-dependent malic enzyme [Candidatus Algichlamydia australiensis]|nr:NAD-dependent malic enzyme [Chlamydiales bacterium]
MYNETDLEPQSILYHPLYNKGTGFTAEERRELGLEGLLPPHISTIEEQLARRYENFCQKRSMLGKYRYLSALQDRNETLYYRFVYEHIEECLPLIYTPTVGEASVHHSYIYSQNRGVYFSYQLRDRMEEMVERIPRDQVDVIVVTDGERILGLGDLGVGGMTIPVGKLALYTLFGGIHPGRTLPVLLDVGTNNPALIDDPLYLGCRHERIRGKEYDEFIDRFVKAIKKRFPKVLLQWEDFANPNAFPLLERYQEQICSFNDDIQGTASVALAAIFAAVRKKGEKITQQRIAILGGGSAGMGIAHLLYQVLIREGLSEKEAREKFYILDIQGLVHTKIAKASPAQKEFAQDAQKIAEWKVENPDNITLTDVAKHAHPTILIGVSTQPGAFTEEAVREMYKHCNSPAIFPLSNPTAKAEAQPEDLLKWTEGNAIVATGSPFPPVTYQETTYQIGQCNNVYIFPGVGLGVIAAKSKKVTIEMFVAAAKMISEESPMLQDPTKNLFPNFSDLRSISRKIAIEVAKIAKKQGHATAELPDIEKAVEENIWFPKYVPLHRKK